MKIGDQSTTGMSNNFVNTNEQNNGFQNNNFENNSYNYGDSNFNNTQQQYVDLNKDDNSNYTNTQDYQI